MPSNAKREFTGAINVLKKLSEFLVAVLSFFMPSCHTG